MPTPDRTINIPAKLHQELKIQAAREGIPVKRLIAQVLAAALGLELEPDES